MQATPSDLTARKPGRSRWILLLWLLAGGAIFSFLRGPDVSRSQEARVLETAREMIGSGVNGWLVPHLNGHRRLEKPPLAYWMAAGSFKLFGVGPANGRLPFAVLGWLTVALLYCIGRDLYNRVVGVAAAAALLAGYLFFRHARLAETDGPATLFAAAATWWLWKGLLPTDDPHLPGTRAARLIDLHLSAFAWALALLSKQGTAVYPLAFFILWLIVERRWKSIGAWLLSGAPLTLLVIGLPWFLWIGHSIGWRVFIAEAKNVAEGTDHGSIWPFMYLPMLLVGAAPWGAVTLLAIASTSARWKRDARLRFALLWAASVALPLCLILNKQNHYLVPLMPPLALLAGWLIDRALHDELSAATPKSLSDLEHRWLRWIVGLTLLAGVLAAGAIFFIGQRKRGGTSFEDVLLAAALLFVCAWGLAIFPRKAAVAALYGFCATALVMPFVVGRWLPSLDRNDHRVVAARIGKRMLPIVDGTYAPKTLPLKRQGRSESLESLLNRTRESGLRFCFFGPNISLPLGWTLRQIVPQYETEAELLAALKIDPKLVVIAETKKNSPAPAVPRPLELVIDDHLDDQALRVYFARPRSKAATTNPASRATQPSTRRGGSTPANPRPR